MHLLCVLRRMQTEREGGGGGGGGGERELERKSEWELFVGWLVP